MSRMGDLIIDIQEMFYNGIDPTEISNRTGMPLETILEVIKEYDDSGYDESMDGDFDSAMTSAGFGTDEDYGYFGDE